MLFLIFFLYLLLESEDEGMTAGPLSINGR
jgi:hypothetical protein